MPTSENRAPRDIAVFVGSLRKESFSRKLANGLKSASPSELALEVVEIGDLPLYNQDLEANPPASWKTLRERVRRASGVLFVTPEYNRSLPAVLKNAIDVASRPYGKNAWQGKPGGVVSVSPGAIGGFGANHHLRQSLVFLNVLALQQPEAYIGGADKLFDAAGDISDASTRDFVSQYMNAFAAWVARVGAS
jgi:chromate reductase